MVTVSPAKVTDGNAARDNGRTTAAIKSLESVRVMVGLSG
jgi:hypothetical protein